MEPLNTMWTEKYRPKKISEVIGNVREKIQKHVEDPNKMQHMLFHSIVPGTGKCLGKDTPIIMFDGSIKKVQDIIEGDRLMGPDSKPRIVKGVTKGRSKLYSVKQKYGDDYVVNKDHILSLVSSHKNNIKNVNIEEYLTYSKQKQIDLKGYKVGIDFKEKKINLDPYLLGLWLGDGSSASQRIHNPDKEVINFLKQYAESIGYELKNHNGKESKDRCGQWTITKGRMGGANNIFLDLLRTYNLLDNKHIPDNYLYNNKKIRLELLAGILDADGYKDGQGYEITQKNVILANQIVYLARSLGFRTTIRDKISTIKSTGFSGNYKRIHINGKVWEIPCKIKRKIIKKHKRQKNALRYGIEVEEKGYGNYYGFTVDKDGLFLLGDFTVTHNTTMALAIINELGADSLIINSSKDRKIETIRESVNNFVMTQSSKVGVRRIVFLDEADGLTSASQDALRNLMETYASNAIFILTCNHRKKIIEPLASRCLEVKFGSPDKKEIVTYLKMICENELLKYTDEGLVELVEKNYPSIRNCVKTLQELHTEGKEVTKENAREADEELEMLWGKVYKDKDWKFVQSYIFKNSIDVRLLNKYIWTKAIEISNIKLIQVTGANEKYFPGSDEVVIFITSLIEMTK